ncbi:MAG: serine/threonine-protein kinase [Actinomycetota bacterium]
METQGVSPIPGFEVLGEPRHGGTSTVVRARWLERDELVALKIAAPGHERRVDREGDLGRLLDHPNLAVPIGAGRTDDGRTWVASRWVDGRTLDEILRVEGRLSLTRARAVVVDVAAALSSLHGAGITHRDVSPSNVMVSGPTAVLIDVGLGRRDGAVATVTATGELAGTPRYLAPELIRGDTPTPSADQYSLAIVAAEMLTGSWSFPSDGSVAAALHHQLSTPPTPVDELRPDVPAGPTRAISRALSKSPEDRWPSVEDFASAFTRDDAPTTPSVHRIGAIAAVVGAIALVAGVALSALGSDDDDGQPTASPAAAGPSSADQADPTVTTNATDTTESSVAPIAPTTTTNNSSASTTGTTTPTDLAAAAGPDVGPDTGPEQGPDPDPDPGQDDATTAPIPASIPSTAPSGAAAALACNLVADAGFTSGFIGDNFFDNPDAEEDGRERVLPSGGVDGSEVLVIGDPGRYGLFGNEVGILPGQRYEFSAALLPVDPLFEATMSIAWLDGEYQLLDEVGAELSLIDVEPGRHSVVSQPAPDAARFAIPTLLKDASPGLLLADELVFAEADAGCRPEAS